MNQEVENKIKLFDQKLRSDRINKEHKLENEITDYYYQILNDLVSDYQIYRDYFPSLLASIENNDAKLYSITIFFQLYDKVFSSCYISELDITQFTEKITPEALEKLKDGFKECLASGNIIRISKFDFNVDGFTEHEIKECISFLVDLLQSDSEAIEWSDKLAQDHLIQLAVMKSLLKSLGNNQYFYFVIAMFFDRLNTSEFFQSARDLAEEIIITSFNDGVPELGFLNSYHCYSRQGSLDAAILYANMCLFVISISKKFFTK